MDKKKLPYETRKQNVIDAIIVACKENDLEVVPVLQPGLQELKAMVIYVDMQDPLMKKKFGLGGDDNASPSGLLTN
jgi:hypothetical protein